MTLPVTPSDEDLLRLTMAGDEEAFTSLYRRRQSSIYRFALHMSGSRPLAEDVTQEVFMTLIRDGARFDAERGSLAAFLYGVARNHVLRRIERDRMLVPLSDNGDSDDAVMVDSLMAEGDPLGDLTRNESIAAVRGAVLALPAHYREVVVMCDLHEMSYAAAAEVIGCAVGTVRSRLHRARALLVEKLRATHEPAHAATPARCFA